MFQLLALARAAGGRLLARRGTRFALTGAAGAGGGLIPGFFGGGDDRPRRRRRKTILTKGDKEDIAFIVATLGPAAGGRFALIVAARA